MLQRLWRSIRIEPRLSRWDFVLTLLPAVLWAGVFHLRPHVIDLHCIETPVRCTGDFLFGIDRWSLPYRNPVANAWSFYTQYAAAVVAWGIPLVIHLWQRSFRRLGTDALLIFQITLWNGFFMESARLLAQRPRPFVFHNPADKGLDIANYTSFYSGHTSFAAAATLGLLLIFIARGYRRWVIGLGVLTWVGITFSTGLFRVLAGVHFTTDVLVAALMGSLVALGVFQIHRR